MKLLTIISVFLLFTITITNASVILKEIGIPFISSQGRNVVDPEWGTIEQKLDHFNDKETRTWNMRYMNNSQFFEAGGPIFIFLGGEWTIFSGYLTVGHFFDLAKLHQGYMFQTEHRYYGESYPTKDYSVESLKYLTVRQALADIAHFISYKKETMPELANSKVILVGGSYSATLAIWARLLYPELVYAAYGSSGPLLAIEDFYAYQEVVSENIYINNKKCWDTIGEGVKEIEKHFESESGRKYLEKELNICGEIKANEPYRSYLFSSISIIFSNLIQYAYPGEIQDQCDDILKFNGTSLEKLAAYIRLQMFNECIGDYEEIVAYYNKTELTTDNGRQWIYQTCTEFGFFQTSNSPKQLFGQNFGVDYNLGLCRDIFGIEFTSEQLQNGIESINKQFGGVNPQATRVISVHGSVDPWHRLGVLQDISESNIGIFVNGTSHCADLVSINELDLEEMRKAKEYVDKLITKWIYE